MKRLMLSVALAAAWAGTAHADMSGNGVKIGVLTDQSGVFSSLAGKGSVVAAQMALLLALIPLAGTTGAALATAASTALQIAGTVLLARRLLGVRL